MLFKNFDIDGDFVLIDDQKVFRPSYISVSSWYDFWDFAPEANDSENIRSIIDQEVDSIVRSNEMEHEEELEKQARDITNSFDSNVEQLLKIARSMFDNLEDAIENIRPVKDE